jgi:hypothetical protein
VPSSRARQAAAAATAAEAAAEKAAAAGREAAVGWQRREATLAAQLKRSVPLATAEQHRGAAASLAVRAAAAQGAYDETLAELEAQVRTHRSPECVCVT